MDLSLNAPENPWSSNDVLLGVTLGDPRSGLVVARRCGLLPDRQVILQLIVVCFFGMYVGYNVYMRSKLCQK